MYATKANPLLTPEETVSFFRNAATGLLIMRLSIAAFWAMWVSLKFYHPEWVGNIYGKDVVSGMSILDVAFFLGIVQALIVLAFALGAFRTFTYGALTIMHAYGLWTAVPRLLEWTTYPNNLLWTSVPTLGALICLFLLRKADAFSIDGMRAAR
ncbi:hypothetical protein N9H93_05235 [Rhizobiaceae bacterium]|nr:hypothetical protein [Rhizobiaceae bacterium]